MPKYRYIALVLFLSLMSLVNAEDAAAKLNESLYVGKPVVVDNVTVWAVYSTKPQEGISDFLTLAQAQEKKLAEVRETGAPPNGQQVQTNANVQPPPAQTNADHVQQREAAQNGAQGQLRGGDVSGEVNELVIENKSDKPIMVLAGTLVKGGKQDRQIAEDFIIQPGKTVPVGAFCVEHGRWTSDREDKNTQGVFEAQKVLAVKEVRESAQYEKNQGRVWENVAINNAKASKSPGTGTLLASVEETDKDAIARRDHLRKEIAAKFESVKADAPVGLAYAIDGKIKEIRTFSHNKLFALYSDTLINTVVIEGELAQREAIAKKQEIYKGTVDAKQAVELLSEANTLKEDVEDTKAGNRNGYKKNGKVNNANCYFDTERGAASAAPVSQSWSAK